MRGQPCTRSQEDGEEQLLPVGGQRGLHQPRPLVHPVQAVEHGQAGGGKQGGSVDEGGCPGTALPPGGAPGGHKGTQDRHQVVTRV